jgi:hypothetical protein
MTPRVNPYKAEREEAPRHLYAVNRCPEQGNSQRR